MGRSESNVLGMEWKLEIDWISILIERYFPISIALMLLI
jgi:hypothetical protein